MKKILKNYNYLSMLISLSICLVFLLTILFVKDASYFTVAFIGQIMLHFAVTSVLLLGNLENNKKFSLIIGYLILGFLLLLLQVFAISKLWDYSIYENVMYIVNIQLYLLLYLFFICPMVLLSGYTLIKNFQKKDK